MAKVPHRRSVSLLSIRLPPAIPRLPNPGYWATKQLLLKSRRLGLARKEGKAGVIRLMGAVVIVGIGVLVVERLMIQMGDLLKHFHKLLSQICSTSMESPLLSLSLSLSLSLLWMRLHWSVNITIHQHDARGYEESSFLIFAIAVCVRGHIEAWLLRQNDGQHRTFLTLINEG